MPHRTRKIRSNYEQYFQAAASEKNINIDIFNYRHVSNLAAEIARTRTRYTPEMSAKMQSKLIDTEEYGTLEK